jgi:glutathione S-transferase
VEEIILHQYDVSPFSEKIRKVLALKKLSWRSVEQPIVAPKPKLTALTGGYRRIPVLQIGADVYCDTALIARVLDERHPEPSCFPKGQAGAAEIVAQWADHWLFMAVVPLAVVNLIAALPAEFMKDREAMSPGFTVEAMKGSLPDARSRLAAALGWLDAQLSSHPFVLGEAFSVADAACFHNLWFLRNNPESFATAAGRAGVKRWFDRVEAMGMGAAKPLEPDEAIAVARRSSPATSERSDGLDRSGLQPGDRVSVRADDYGTETVTGMAVVVTADEIAIRREDPDAGEVVVHFPRAGYRVTRA